MLPAIILYVPESYTLSYADLNRWKEKYHIDFSVIFDEDIDIENRRIYLGSRKVPLAVFVNQHQYRDKNDELLSTSTFNDLESFFQKSTLRLHGLCPAGNLKTCRLSE